MAPRRARESKQGLIIALVFAVLIILGLGVTAYYGFNGQEALRKEAKDAKDKAASMEKDRNWYKFQAQYFRAYIGIPSGIDFADLGAAKGLADGGSLGGTDKDAVSGMMKQMETRLPWDAAQNRPKQTYEDLLKQEKERADGLRDLSERLTAAKADAERAQKKATDDLKNARLAFDDALVQQQKKTDADMSGLLDKIKAQQSELNRQNEEKEQIVKTASSEKKKGDEEKAKLGATNKDLKNALEDKSEKYRVLASKGVELAPKGWQSDWKIVSIDRTGTLPFINIGSADHVQPQLTFSVHARGPAGQPVPESKGSLEVISVLGPHLSQTRMLTVKDRNKEPILKGDILYNPTWSPGEKKHVALVGIMDLNGDGQNNVYDLIRTLEKQNVEVDAYIDPRDNTLKGKGVTARTDYLIEGKTNGDVPSGDERERQKEQMAKWLEENAKLERAAKDNGVQIVRLPDFLEQLGYRHPRNATEGGAPSSSVLPANPPADPGAAPKKDEKAKEDKPAADDKPADEKPKEDKPKEDKPK
jgi:hypothetical protein